LDSTKIVNLELIKIRLADLKDIEALVQLRVLMQTEVQTISNDKVDPNYQEKVKQYFNEAISSESLLCVVAELENKVIGTSGICIYKKPPSITGDSNYVGYVTNVYTEIEFRKRGIALKMMAFLVKIAEEKRVNKLHLGATSDALNLYKSLGFKEPHFVNLEKKLNILNTF
jgi:ribosomal protein S18 acetylase RimI-like enzyme